MPINTNYTFFFYNVSDCRRRFEYSRLAEIHILHFVVQTSHAFSSNDEAKTFVRLADRQERLLGFGNVLKAVDIHLPLHCSKLGNTLLFHI